jgi:pimeloyl-ACP methyl ester carboxylesterase
MSQPGKSIYVRAEDGLRIHARSFGSQHGARLPVVCLPGLTRTGADFDTLAQALATGPNGRQVLAIDMRGRGRSDYDPKPENYNIGLETSDILAVLRELRIESAVFLGSSRGGLQIMLLAATHPSVIAGAILNDIGPVLDPAGVARLKSYVGKIPTPTSYEDGADILCNLFGAQFPKAASGHWLAAARRAWKEENGAFRPTYDEHIAATLEQLDLAQPLPTMWNEFEALAKVPLMLIRGTNSDLLSTTTAAMMRERAPGLDYIEVADEGHVPLLEGGDIIRRISDFVLRCDKAAADRLATAQRI